MNTSTKLKWAYALWGFAFIEILYFFYDSIINTDPFRSSVNYILLIILVYMLIPFNEVKKEFVSIEVKESEE